LATKLDAQTLLKCLRLVKKQAALKRDRFNILKTKR